MAIFIGRKFGCCSSSGSFGWIFIVAKVRVQICLCSVNCWNEHIDANLNPQKIMCTIKCA